MSDDLDQSEPIGSALLDHIYELIENVQLDLERLSSEYDRRTSKVEIVQFPAIYDAFELLSEYQYERRLGITAIDLDKFARMQGSVQPVTMRRVGTRAITLLRELEGQVARETIPAISIDEHPQPEEAAERRLDVRVSVIEWTGVDHRRNAGLIAEISTLLEESVRLARGTNLPPPERALSDIERAQLIALLETALQMLKAPLVEKGLLTTLKNAAKAGAENSVQKHSELALGFGLSKLWDLIVKLLSSLS